jgi:predicted choloylglycine hydrolase
MALRFRSIFEAEPGEKWTALFTEMWPAYQRWFLREGEAKRPSYLRAGRMLAEHMPELVPMWHRLVDLAGGGDHVARLLSLYRPTPYLSGCSQAVWTREPGPMLVRNYDYHPDLCEGVLLCSAWHGTKVIAMSDCLWGVLDGMNEHGLAGSLAFGGRSVVGDGFGIPLVLRYILEFCRDVDEAVAVLARVPSHMAYNVTVADARGAFATVQVGPDRPAAISRDAKVATNHQGDAEGSAHAVRTHSLERERSLKDRVDDPAETRDRFVRSFLASPIANSDYERAFGTLYTATYEPAAGTMGLLWPGERWRRSFSDFAESERLVEYGDSAGS